MNKLYFHASISSTILLSTSLFLGNVGVRLTCGRGSVFGVFGTTSGGIDLVGAEQASSMMGEELSSESVLDEWVSEKEVKEGEGRVQEMKHQGVIKLLGLILKRSTEIIIL